MVLVAEEVAGQVMPRQKFQPGGAKTTVLSMLSSVGAVLAACSCCILPMLLAGIGLSGSVGSAISPLGPLRWPMAGLSLLMLAISWITVFRQRQRACGCGKIGARQWLRSPKILMLILASLLTTVAVSWGLFEPTLMRWML